MDYTNIIGMGWAIGALFVWQIVIERGALTTWRGWVQSVGIALLWWAIAAWATGAAVRDTYQDGGLRALWTVLWPIAAVAVVLAIVCVMCVAAARGVLER